MLLGSRQCLILRCLDCRPKKGKMDVIRLPKKRLAEANQTGRNREEA